jgi:hypothetical protein
MVRLLIIHAFDPDPNPVASLVKDPIRPDFDIELIDLPRC